MSKDIGDISNAAKGMLGDVNGLIPRFENYLKLAPLDYTRIDKQILFMESALSVLEGLGAKLIRENLAESEIITLTNAMHRSGVECLKLCDDQKQIDKIKLNMAKTEAALKGFELPLSLSGPAADLDSKGLEMNEYLIPMEATKRALLEVSGKNISKEEYAAKIIERANTILKQDSRNFPVEKLQQYSEFISQGTKVKKPTKLNEQEVKLLSDNLSKSVSSFVERFDQNTEMSKEVQNFKGQIILSKSVNGVLNDSVTTLTDKKYNLTPEMNKTIKEHLMPALEKLGPDYLAANSQKIIDDIAKELYSNRSWWSVFSSQYSISGSSLDKIAKNITNNHLESSLQAGEELIYSKIIGAYSDKKDLKIANDQMLSGLNEFLDKMGKTVTVGSETLSQIKDSSEFKFIDNKQLASLRNYNPELFDKLLFGNKIDETRQEQSPQSLETNIEKNNAVKVEILPPPTMPSVAVEKGNQGKTPKTLQEEIQSVKLKDANARELAPSKPLSEPQNLVSVLSDALQKRRGGIVGNDSTDDVDQIYSEKGFDGLIEALKKAAINGDKGLAKKIAEYEDFDKDNERVLNRKDLNKVMDDLKEQAKDSGRSEKIVMEKNIKEVSVALGLDLRKR